MTEQNKNNFSFKSYAWKQLRKNKPALWSIRIILSFAVIALLAPVIANEKPLYVSYKGNSLFPAFSFKNYVAVKTDNGSSENLNYNITNWKKLNADVKIFPLIPYSPGKSDFLNSDYASPGGDQLFEKEKQTTTIPLRYRHWIGTDKRGADVLSGIIHGTRVSLTIGILAMAIASFLGISLGAMAGYFGDDKVKISRGQSWMIVAGIFSGWFFAFQLRSFVLSDALANSGWNIFGQLVLSILIFILVVFLFYQAGKLLSFIPFFKNTVHIPLDNIISRCIEIIISLPRLILIISIAAIARPSLINLMIIIGLTSWTEIARLTRAEFLKIKNLDYIQAAQALGYRHWRIIFKHALPNGIAPALVAIAFGVASAILIESALSFLGIGVPQDVVTWGSLLSAGKENFNAWWLVVFPGLMIFITVTAYNLLGEGLRDALDPRMK